MIHEAEHRGASGIAGQVNRRDVSAVDDLVAEDYRGSGPGWPRTVDELRNFYESQLVSRPDWHIDVQEAVELGDSVVIRAHAHGTVMEGDTAVTAAVDWLAHYRFRGTKIVEINLMSLVRDHRTT